MSGEQFEAAGSDVSSSSAVTSPDQQVSCMPVKTRSCDDLTKAGLDDDDDIVPMMSAQRRLSDPNIAAHSAAAEAAASLAPEANDDDDDDVDVRTDVQCRQSDKISVCEDERPGNADVEGVAVSAAMPAVALVAVDSQKCASNETLKAVEDATCDSAPSGVDCTAARQPFSDANGPSVMAMFQASSDTLTGEDGHLPIVVATECAEPDVLADPPAPDPTIDVVGIHSQVLKVKTMLDRCSSTSDISSSRVADDSALAAKAVVPLMVDTRLATVGNGMAAKGLVNGDGDGPGISQPPSCGSSSPPTPNSDVKV